MTRVPDGFGPEAAIPYVMQTASDSGVSPRQILGRSRRVPVVAARHECWKRMRKDGWSYPAIGEAFGVHHSTVMSAARERPQQRKRPPIPLYGRPSRGLAGGSSLVCNVSGFVLSGLLGRPMTKAELAKSCGVSTATVARALSWLRRRGVPITFSRRTRRWHVGGLPYGDPRISELVSSGVLTEGEGYALVAEFCGTKEIE